MNEEIVLNLGRDTIFTTILIAGPLLLSALITGLLVSVLQAITQINEATLTFIPKIIAIIVTILVMAPWMTQIMVNFTEDLIISIPENVR